VRTLPDAARADCPVTHRCGREFPDWAVAVVGGRVIGPGSAPGQSTPEAQMDQE
jgi:hypothetical protein